MFALGVFAMAYNANMASLTGLGNRRAARIEPLCESSASSKKISLHCVALEAVESFHLFRYLIEILFQL